MLFSESEVIIFGMGCNKRKGVSSQRPRSVWKKQSDDKQACYESQCMMPFLHWRRSARRRCWRRTTVWCFLYGEHSSGGLTEDSSLSETSCSRNWLLPVRHDYALGCPSSVQRTPVLLQEQDRRFADSHRLCQLRPLHPSQRSSFRRILLENCFLHEYPSYSDCSPMRLLELFQER